MASFVNLVKPTATQPKTQLAASGQYGSGNIFLRDQLTIQGWLEVGACLTVVFMLVARPLIGPYALLLPFAAVAYRLATTLLTLAGVLRNKHMDGVIMNKYSAQIPNADGTYGPKPANTGVTVLLIGAKNNHPLGLLAPGFKKTGEWMTRMQDELNASPEKYGVLGASSWLEQGRSTNNELLIVMYFKTSQQLHDYAHGPLHREAWNWWNKNIASLGHIAIWHECFVVPEGHWESIYVNSKPTLMGATSHLRKTDQGRMWFSPAVDASRGVLRSSNGRLKVTDGQDNNIYEGDPYANYGKLEAQY